MAGDANGKQAQVGCQESGLQYASKQSGDKGSRNARMLGFVRFSALARLGQTVRMAGDAIGKQTRVGSRESGLQYAVKHSGDKGSRNTRMLEFGHFSALARLSQTVGMAEDAIGEQMQRQHGRRETSYLSSLSSIYFKSSHDLLKSWAVLAPSCPHQTKLAVGQIL